MAKYYAGIGSRETPSEVLSLMSWVAQRLELKGYTLRSGGARGADTAFESRVTDKQIFLTEGEYQKQLPRRLSNNEQPNQHFFEGSVKACYVITRLLHPKGSSLSKEAMELHSRNVYQILGRDLNTPSEFVICYTKDGSGAGGTGQAIRLAKLLNIPVIDIGKYQEINHAYNDILDIFNLHPSV